MNVMVAKEAKKHGEVIIGHFLAGVEEWRKSGEALLEAEKEIPKFAEWLIGQEPRLDDSMLETLRNFANGLAEPELWLSQKPGYVRLRDCRPELQRKHLVEPLTIVVERDGKTQRELIPLDKLTAVHVQQGFVGRRTRTPDEQDKWLAERKQPLPKKPHVTPTGIWFGSYFLPWDELRSLLAQAPAVPAS